MNSKVLKWIAIITMTIDHIGFYLFPESLPYFIMRAIGRIAYPLFAFMIAEGYHHTHDVKAYFKRLLIGALVMEAIVVGFYFATGTNMILTINVFIPLAFGLLALILFNQPQWYYKLLIIPILVFAAVFKTSYGVYGILTILIFGILERKFDRLLAFMVMSLFLQPWPIAFSVPASYLQWFALLAFIPIFLYNGKLGRFNKWFFYLYYPLHLAIILAIQILWF